MTETEILDRLDEIDAIEETAPAGDVGKTLTLERWKLHDLLAEVRGED